MRVLLPQERAKEQNMTKFNTQLRDIVKSEQSDLIQHHGEEMVVPQWRERINHQHLVQLRPSSAAPLEAVWP